MGNAKALSAARQGDQSPFSFKPCVAETGNPSLTGLNTEEEPAGERNTCLNLLMIKLRWQAERSRLKQEGSGFENILHYLAISKPARVTKPSPISMTRQICSRETFANGKMTAYNYVLLLLDTNV